MEAELTTLHLVIALAAFALFGAIGHVVRGMVNMWPDRLSDSAALDLMVSNGYSLTDHFLSVEYDDYGYYRLDSLKNLQISVVLSIIGGGLVMALSEGADVQTAQLMNIAGEWLTSLFQERLSEIGIA
jgi:hypothetical protein